MDEIEVRLAKEEDIRGMLAIDTSCFSMPWGLEAFENEMAKINTTYVVALLEDKLVGFAGFWKIFDEGHITRVAVNKEYRGRHVGCALLKGLIEEGSKREIIDYTLEMRKSNVTAMKLYEKFGFLVEGIRPKYYQNNMEDAIVLWRRVK